MLDYEARRYLHVKLRMRGFSLIEMMIVVVIVAILTLVAMPSFAEWLQNSRTRSVADSLQNGIRYAQTEAARLSRLTTVATVGATWTVTYTQLPTVDSGSATLQTSPKGDEVAFVTITPDIPAHAALQFNNLGRVFYASSAAGPFTALTGQASFLVQNPNGPRKLSVVVNAAGKVRMCDPNKTFSDTNPDGC